MSLNASEIAKIVAVAAFLAALLVAREALVNHPDPFLHRVWYPIFGISLVAASFILPNNPKVYFVALLAAFSFYAAVCMSVEFSL